MTLGVLELIIYKQLLTIKVTTGKYFPWSWKYCPTSGKWQ